MSANAFVEQQEKKKAALDEFMKGQKDRLASLNSPLPFLPKVPKVNSKPKPKAPDAVIPSLNLADLTMKKSKTPSEKPVTPPPTTVAAATPRLNLMDLTMTKKPKESQPPVPPSAAESSPRLSLAEMTMLKKPQAGGTTPQSIPVTTKSSGNKPIRQSIPTRNDKEDDDDFFEYSRGGDNSGMSIKDIMARENGSDSSGNTKTDAAKAQSKMWGIDIDKFTD